MLRPCWTRCWRARAASGRTNIRLVLKKPSERAVFIALLVSSVAFSVGGVAVAVMLRAPVHGGRGGALATALALTGLFATRNSSGLVYTALTDTTLRVRSTLADLKGGSQTLQLTADERLQAFETRLRMDAEGVRIQNAFMACSTAVATVFWGFGDLFAEWLMASVVG